ncbi:hypothetical protein V490_06125 [Pseudogymnoascus sp. VKM F-3557]|nr:hypothetical protein V490_06125 [Pseudogymnoascus sp. VKM F-3557]
MNLFKLFVGLFALLWTSHATNNGLQDVVEWDKYSLMINGKREFIYSAEFAYQRMPVPELWLDLLHKFRANGFNAVSLYFFWSYHSASKDVYDFETSGKNVQRLLDYCKEAGLYVIARSGPYVNAETNAGGFPLWGSDGSMGNLRTSDETYHQSWLPWVAKMGKIIADNEITKGGPIILNQIENELQETSHVANATAVVYMEQLKAAFLDAKITVPSTHNEKGQRAQSWSTDYLDVGGAVNIYGLDSYPGGTSCTNINSGYNVVRNYYQWFSNYSYTQPSYVPEFEGGWFSPWGGSFYDDCLAEHSPEFADIYYKNNVGQRITMQNLYMTWGGTNWGHSAAPVVYTSYDYSAPLRETRQQWDKLYQTKLLGLFTRVSKDLLKTYMVGNGTGWSVSTDAIWTWELANPDTKTGFYVVQHAATNSRNNETFSIDLTTTKGNITVPNVSLTGRQSKIIVTDYTFGKHALLYSTAEVLTYGVFDVDVLVFYLREGHVGQFAFKGMPSHLTYKVYGKSKLESTTANGITTYVYTQSAGTSVVKFSDGTIVYLLELWTAWQFWAPATTKNPTVEADEQIFVIGPYLTRSAYVNHGDVYVSGDSNSTTTLEVYAGKSVKNIVWNGKKLPTTKTAWGSVTAKIAGTEHRHISLPEFKNWRSANSLPEINPDYDDSHWVVCNKNTTLSPVKPLTLPVLFSSDYGFYAGAKVYRGYFDGTSATSVNLTTSGGLGFGFNAWLNGQLIGGHGGDPDQTNLVSTLSFANATLRATNNVLVVLIDYHGHDETSTAKGVENPRGILGASLSTGPFKKWKIQGNAGGSANIDPVRGPMNEGGLYAERLGWHLPGFDVSKWSHKEGPKTGLSKSGVQFYVTTFRLAIDADLDAPLGIEFSAPAGTVARLMFWVNGYQFGKAIFHIGPQLRFPVPPGIINNRGENTLAISLWAQTDEGARISDVKLINYGLYQTDFEFNADWRYLQPKYVGGREKYA